MGNPEKTPSDLDWSDDHIDRFWDYWSCRPEVYFSEAYGNSIVGFSASYLKPECRVLDFGCGTGGLIEALTDHGYRTTGLEFSPRSRENVAERYSGRGDFEGVLDLQELLDQSRLGDRWDAIFCIETIEHLNDNALGEMFFAAKEVLSADGVLILTTPNGEDIVANRVFCPVCSTVFHPMQHIRSFTRESLAGCLEDHGFSCLRMCETDFGALFRTSYLKFAIRMLKHVLYRNYREPHLVSIARPK
jgi:2-polyprenyl-3-methyl-5-hydroxy-6-metoxy-1,4-benzoquinol methylase